MWHRLRARMILKSWMLLQSENHNGPSIDCPSMTTAYDSYNSFNWRSMSKNFWQCDFRRLAEFYRNRCRITRLQSQRYIWLLCVAINIRFNVFLLLELALASYNQFFSLAYRFCQFPSFSIWISRFCTHCFSR